MGQKINIPSQNQPFRKQSSLGGDVSFRNLNGTNDNSFITLEELEKDFNRCAFSHGWLRESYKIEFYYAKVKLRLQEIDNPENYIETEYLKPIITSIKMVD